MIRPMNDDDDGLEPDGTVTSKELAALIVDALLRASLLNEKDVARAVAIATEEIEVQKVGGGTNDLVAPFRRTIPRAAQSTSARGKHLRFTERHRSSVPLNAPLAKTRTIEVHVEHLAAVDGSKASAAYVAFARQSVLAEVPVFGEVAERLNLRRAPAWEAPEKRNPPSKHRWPVALGHRPTA
jgi:hypothetical protein